MEVAEGKLKTKLIQLNITTNRTKSIVDNCQAEAIERHKKTRKRNRSAQNNRASKGRGFRCVECKCSDTNCKGRSKCGNLESVAQ
jgi:hypothetical protein